MGIGTGMVLRINEIAALAGFQAIVADTGVNNKGMQGVFKRTGFKVLTENVYFIKRFSQTEKRTIDEQTGIGVNARVPLVEKLEQIQKPSSEKDKDDAKDQGKGKTKVKAKIKAQKKVKTKAKTKDKENVKVKPKDKDGVKTKKLVKYKVKTQKGQKPGRKGR